MIKTILFDLSEVHLTGMVGAEEPIAAALGRGNEEVWENMNHPALMSLFRGEISESAYWESVIKAGAYPNKIDGTTAQEFLSTAVRRNFREIPGTADLVRAIAEQKRYDIVMLSDHAREWVDYIERQFQLSVLFPRRFYSFEIGYTKKQPQSFRHALRYTDADPQTTLFVDDSQRNIDVAQSRDVGIAHTHRFESQVSLYRFLQSYGIL